VTPIRPMRVLHLRTISGTTGGPDKTVLHSCAWLNRRGHVAEAFCMVDRQSDVRPLRARARQLGVRLDLVVENGPLSLRTLGRLRRVLETGRYQIVHTHEYKSTVLAHLLRARYGYRIVTTAHGYSGTTRREALYYGLERMILRHVDAVIAPTSNMCALLARFGVPRGRLHRVPNGIGRTGRSTSAGSHGGRRARLLYVGRLSPEKDPRCLLWAFAMLAHRGLDVELTLLGDGPERRALRALAVRLGVGDRVRMPGFVPDVGPWLAGADVLISPSRTECMPNAVLEAMSVGVPVVATAVGGVPEMIRHGVDGLLCPPCRPDVLAGAVHRLLSNGALARRLAGNAYRRARGEFDFGRRMERVLELYRRVLARSRRSCA